MSWRASAWAKTVTTGSPAAKAVLLCLADYADADHACFPGQDRLAAESEQSVRTVARHLQVLEARGLITREARYEGGHRTSDRYVLAVDQAADTGQSVRLDQTGQSVGHEQPEGSSYQTPDAVIPDNGDRSYLTPVSEEPPVEPSEEEPLGSGRVAASEPVTETVSDPSPSSLNTDASVPSLLPDLAPQPNPLQPTSRARQLPDPFVPNDQMREWFARQGLADVVDGVAETEQFIDHHRSRGSTMKDWPAAWRTWMRNAAKFQHRPRRPGNVHHLPTSDPDQARRADWLSQTGNPT